MIGLSATKLGTLEAWKTAEMLVFKTLEDEIKEIKEKNLPLSQISKLEIFAIIHALTSRKV